MRLRWVANLIWLTGFLSTGALWAQGGSPVAGSVVTTRSGLPVSGAQVTVSGTTRSVLTDARGMFRIEGVPAGPIALEVRRIGYRPVTRQATAGTTDVRIELQEVAVELNALVVTGTAGEAQRRSLGNAVSEINARELTDIAPVTETTQLINGRAAGVTVATGSGIVGGGANILIRGVSNLRRDTNPLLFIDGVRVNNDPATGPASTADASSANTISRLNDFDPSEIESIEIIKGPAAATLYGTESAAGVIQIITKRGRAGAARWNVRASGGANWFQNPEGRIPLSYWRNPATGQVETLNIVEHQTAVGRPLFRNGGMYGLSADVSGGSDRARYFVALNWDDENGFDPMNQSRRLNGRGNADFFAGEAFDGHVSFGLAKGRTYIGSRTLIDRLRYNSPEYLDGPTRGFFDQPPEAEQAVTTQYQDLVRATTGIAMNHRPASWFTHRLQLGLDFSDQYNVLLNRRVPAIYQEFYSGDGLLGARFEGERVSAFATVDYSGTLQLPVSKQIGTKTSVGLQYYSRTLRDNSLSGQRFPGSDVTDLAGASIRTGSAMSLQNTTVGVFVQEEVSWKDRLYLTAALRGDDNSAFGQDFDFVIYPKLSVSWVAIEREEAGRLGINTLRFRSAFGVSGQQPAAFSALRTYAPVTGPGDFPAGTPGALGNPQLGPERGQEFEIGFETGLLRDRASIDFTFYDRTTKDAIVARSIPPSLGFPGTQLINAGTVNNKGVEALIRVRPIESRRLAWDLSLNYAYNKNNVVSLGVPDLPFLTTGFLLNRFQAGYPAGAWFLQRIASANLDANGRAINILCDDGSGGTASCSTAPRLFLGQPYPKHTAGLMSTVTLWQRLALYAQLDMRAGSKIQNSELYHRCNFTGITDINVFPEQFPATVVAECQLPSSGYTHFLEDNSFVKLRELSARWTVPQRLARAINASSASIGVAGRNLHTWTKFRGFDPEIYTVANFLGSVHNEATIPLPAVFTVSITLGF